ncbi:MAG TPA: type III secretion system outer membrane ring subunit SctC [Stenotrophomonas sp.]|nr:type III secretion system outer membrane ring subunit SctC [Stenotrophomonas sp.]
MRKTSPLFATSVMLMACVAPPALAANAWSSTPLTINGLDRPVGEVLREVISAGGLRADVPPRLRGTVSGTLNQRPREAFLRLVDAYNLQWWRDGDIIHVTPMTDTQTRSFDVSPLSGRNAVALLRSLGVLNPHLPLAVSGSIVRISGPARYLASAAEALESGRRQSMAYRAGVANDMVIRVFPLKHARASDSSYENGERTVHVPGVASVISQLLQGMPSASGEALPATMLAGSGSHATNAASSMMADEGVVTAAPDPAAGQAVAHRQTNAVLVRAPATLMAGIGQVIAELDVPQRSVEIEATIIDIASDAQTGLGVDWLSLGAARQDGQFIDLERGQSTGFIARIRALEASGKARVQAQPKIHTLDNTEAVISSVERMNVRVASERDAQLFTLDAGLRLRVVPSIGADDTPGVRLSIDLKDGSLDAANAVDGIPTIHDHTIATQAIVQDGHSLLIGGYTLTRQSNSRRRIPFLSRIPLLGRLFRSRRTREDRFQRIVMITPRLPEAAQVASRAPQPGVSLQ